VALHEQSDVARSGDGRESTGHRDPDPQIRGRLAGRRPDAGPYLEDRTPLKFAQLVERALGGFMAPAL